MRRWLVAGPRVTAVVAAAVVALTGVTSTGWAAPAPAVSSGPAAYPAVPLAAPATSTPVAKPAVSGSAAKTFAAAAGENQEPLLPPAGAISTFGESFEGVTPSRLLDTRPGSSTVDGLGLPHTKLGAGQTITVQISGRAGLPATGVGAALLNVTATGGTAITYLTVWPTGQTRPATSNINVAPGASVPNAVLSRLGRGGTVSIFNAGGTVDVLVDLQGWFLTDQGVTAINPARLADTRPGGTTVDQKDVPGKPVAAGGTLQVGVAGRGGVPAAGVGAVVLNVTGTAATSTTYLTVWPTGKARPTASNLNLTRGATAPVLVIVPVGAGGAVSVFNSSGSTHVIVDVMGYFTTADAGFTALTPARLLDTRVGGATIDGQGRPGKPVGNAGIQLLKVAGRGGVPANGVTAVEVTVTGVTPTASTYLTVFPTGQQRPVASNLNLAARGVRANSLVVPIGADGQISIFNAAGNTHVLLDVQGWFAAGNQDRSTAVPAPTTTTLASADVASITGDSTTTATLLLRPSATPPVVGRDITMAASALTPAGFLGKVTAVTAAPGGALKVTTTPTTLTEAFTSLDTHYQGPIGNPTPVAGVAAASSRNTGTSGPDDLTDGGPATFSFPLSEGYFNCTGAVSISQMSIEFTNSTFEGSLDTNDADKPNGFNFHFNTTPVLTIQAKATGAATCSLNSDKLPSWMHFHKLLPDPEVPLWLDISPTASFSISGSGSIADTLTLFGSYTLDANLATGVKHYQYGRTLSNNFGGATAVKFSAGVGMSASVKLLNAAGVAISLGPTLTTTVTADGCVNLKAQVDLKVSLVLKVWGIGISQQVGDYTWGPWTIYNGTGCQPPPNNTGQGNPNSQPTIDPASDPPAGTVGDAYDNPETETGGTGINDWAITKGTLPPGTAINPGTGDISGTPLRPGDYPVTVTVIDSIGGIGSRDITIHINPLQTNGIWVGSITWTSKETGRPADPHAETTDTRLLTTNWSGQVAGVMGPNDTTAHLDYLNLTGQYNIRDVVTQFSCIYTNSGSSAALTQINPEDSSISVMTKTQAPAGTPQTIKLVEPDVQWTGTLTDVVTGPPDTCPDGTTISTGPFSDEANATAGPYDTPISADPTHLNITLTGDDPPTPGSEVINEFKYTEHWNLQLIDAPDTDFDGYSNYLEQVKYGTDPQDPNSHP